MAGKLPEDKKTKEMRYGTTFGEASLLGDIKILYANPDYPQDWVNVKVNSSGSYNIREYNDKDNEFNTNLDVGQVRGYVSKSKSAQVDGHIDTNSESTIKQNSAGDFGVSYKTGYEVAVAGKNTAIREYNKTFTTSASESKSFNGTFGDQVNEHSGNWHEAFEKDHVQAVKGNKITMIEGGDYAIHAQSGNLDAHVAEKGRIYTGSDLLIESATKITLKVGASTITITSGNIKMVSPRIDLN